MPRLDLTDKFVATIKTKTTADYFDARTIGLGLRVSPAGVKSWSIMFTIPGTQRRGRLSLGTYPATSLARARTLAIEARGKVEAGLDPRAADREEHRAPDGGPMTVATLSETYIAKHASKIKTGKELARRLRRDVIPIIGSIKLADLHRRDVHRVLDRILDHGAHQAAGKAFGDLRAMLRWAVARGDLDHDPVHGMKRPSASKPRERFLEPDEIAALWKAWPKVLPAEVALALKLALVCGQRIGEIAGLDLAEIDFKKALWKLPKERTKNGFSHDVPLSGMALDLIAEARRTAINGRLFPRLNGQKIANWLVRYRAQLPIKDWASHDLRRTFCTNLATMGFSPLVIGACVNHRTQTKSGITLSTYVRYDFAKEKRQALDAWAAHLDAIVRGGAAVLPLRERA